MKILLEYQLNCDINNICYAIIYFNLIALQLPIFTLSIETLLDQTNIRTNYHYQYQLKRNKYSQDETLKLEFLFMSFLRLGSLFFIDPY